MENRAYPPDQTLVIFTDRNGINREGRYLLSMKAFVEAEGDEGPEDCSNVYPQQDIASWQFLTKSDMDGGMIEAF